MQPTYALIWHASVRRRTFLGVRPIGHGVRRAGDDSYDTPVPRRPSVEPRDTRQFSWLIPVRLSLPSLPPLLLPPFVLATRR